MDPVLSSLFPVNQIGSDGFNWWVSQVESEKKDTYIIRGSDISYWIGSVKYRYGWYWSC